MKKDAFLLLALVSLVTFRLSQAAEAQNEIKVDVVGPLTLKFAAVGQS